MCGRHILELWLAPLGVGLRSRIRVKGHRVKRHTRKHGVTEAQGQVLQSRTQNARLQPWRDHYASSTQAAIGYSAKLSSLRVAPQLAFDSQTGECSTGHLH